MTIEEWDDKTDPEVRICVACEEVEKDQPFTSFYVAQLERDIWLCPKHALEVHRFYRLMRKHGYDEHR